MGVELETFLGDWRDSMGHRVRVDWSRRGNPGGQLDVLLIKPNCPRDPIRLNVKALGRGQFACGHYELEVSRSHTDKIVWNDRRNPSKFSEWVREEDGSRGRSRGRSRSRSRRYRSRSRRKHRSRSRSRRRRERNSGERGRDERNASPKQQLVGHHPNGGAHGHWPGGAFPNPPPGSPHGLPPGPPPGSWPGSPGIQGGGHWMPWVSPYPPNYAWLGAPPGSSVAGTAGGRAAGADDLYADLQGHEPELKQPAVPSQSVWSDVSTPGAWAPPAPSQSAQQEPPTGLKKLLQPGEHQSAAAERSLESPPRPVLGDAASATPRNFEDKPGLAGDDGVGSFLAEDLRAVARNLEDGLRETAHSRAPSRNTAPEAVIILNPDGLDESQVAEGPGLQDIVEPSAPSVAHDARYPSPAAPAEPAQDATAGVLATLSPRPAAEVILAVDVGCNAQSDAGRAADPRDPRRRRRIPSPQKTVHHLLQPEPEPEEAAPPEASASTPDAKGEDIEKQKLLLAYDALLLGETPRGM